MLKKMRKKIISVLGGLKCSDEVEQLAKKIGENVAKVANILVFVGLSGRIKAICRDFKEKQNA